MKKLMHILRSRRGDLLVDSMIGAVVVGIIIAVTAGTLVILGKTSVNNTQNTARSIVLNNTISDLVPQVHTLTGTPAVSEAKALDETISIAVWKQIDEDAGISTVYARTAKANNGSPDECTAAEADNPGNCLIASHRLTNDVGGVDVSEYRLVPGSGDVMFRTSSKIPAAVREVRYVFKVTEAPAGDSSMTFASDVEGTATHSVPIPAGKTGYYYGSLLLPESATNISLTPTGPAIFDDTSFFIYGAPNE